MREFYGFGDGSGCEAVWFVAYEHAENLKSGRLPQRSQSRKRVRRRQPTATWCGTDVADNRQRVPCHEAGLVENARNRAW
jgi:hypothetical protein